MNKIRFFDFSLLCFLQNLPLRFDRIPCFFVKTIKYCSLFKKVSSLQFQVFSSWSYSCHSQSFNCSLFIVYCSLFFTKYELYECTNKILFIVQKSLLFYVHCFKFTVIQLLNCYIVSLFIVHCLLAPANCQLPTANCQLPTFCVR